MRALLTILIICMAGCTDPTPGVTVLTYASPFSPGHPFSRADIVWMKWVEQQAGGSIKIQPYWSGSLLSSEHSMHELRHGVADIGLITPIYARGGAHLIRAQAGFYGGLTTFEQQTALWRCMAAADPQFQRELHELKVLAVQGGNLPGIVTRDRPIRTLDDLSGLRLRAPSELLAVLKDLGADPIDMPMGEVYSALAKGVLDGVVAPPDTLKSLHFAEVASYFNTETRLSAAGIPCGMIRDVAEAVSLPALEARRLKLGVNVPGLPEREQVEIVNAGFLFSEDQPGVASPPPRLGQHSDEILQSLGFSSAELQSLHAMK